MYDIVNQFITENLVPASNQLSTILTDATIVLLYVCLVGFVIWVFKLVAGFFTLR